MGKGNTRAKDTADPAQAASLRHQLDEAKTNLQMIEEREAEYVLSTDVSLQLIKERRRLQKRIAELEAQVTRSDVYSHYETGLHQLLSRVKRDHPRYSELLVYQQRLTENIVRSRRYGDSETRKADRSEIIDHLNELSLSALDMPFNDLCTPSLPTTSQEPSEHLRTENLDHSVNATSPFLCKSSEDGAVWLILGETRHHLVHGPNYRSFRKRFGPTDVKSHQEIMQYSEGSRVPSGVPQVVRDERGRTFLKAYKTTVIRDERGQPCLKTDETKAEIKDPRIVDYLSDGQEPFPIASERLAPLVDSRPIPSDAGERMIRSSFYRIQSVEGDEVYLLRDPFIRYIPKREIMEILADRLGLPQICEVPDEDLGSKYRDGPAIPESGDYGIQHLQQWDHSYTPATPQPSQENTDAFYALLVGITAYHNLRPLSKTTRDARDLRDLLAQNGYPASNLGLLLDDQATKGAISDGLDWLARHAGPDDTVIVFFSGHGAQRIGGFEPGEYLCPVEADWYNLRGSAISNEELTTALRAIRAGRVVVFLDACHSGGVGQPKDAALTIKAGLSEATYDRLAEGRGRAVIASCRPDEVSWELPDMRNGLFTHHLLEGLRGAAAEPDGSVGILDLFKYLSQHVPQHKPQHPLFKGEIELNFAITGGAKPPVAPIQPEQAPAAPAAPLKPLEEEMDPNTVDPTKLRLAMHSAYDRPAFEMLCKDLVGLDYHDLRGETLELKMMYLIDWHQRRREYAKLVRRVLEDHPYLAQELR